MKEQNENFGHFGPAANAVGGSVDYQSNDPLDNQTPFCQPMMHSSPFMGYKGADSFIYRQMPSFHKLNYEDLIDNSNSNTTSSYMNKEPCLGGATSSLGLTTAASGIFNTHFRHNYFDYLNK